MVGGGQGEVGSPQGIIQAAYGHVNPQTFRRIKLGLSIFGVGWGEGEIAGVFWLCGVGPIEGFGRG